MRSLFNALSGHVSTPQTAPLYCIINITHEKKTTSGEDTDLRHNTQLKCAREKRNKVMYIKETSGDRTPVSCTLADRLGNSA